MPKHRKTGRSYSSIFKQYSKSEKRWTMFFAVILVIALLNLLFFRDSNEVIEPTTVKGIYTEGVVGHIRSLNPVFSDLNEVERDVSRLIFSGLMKYDAKNNSFVNDLGELTISSDKLTYTFALKKGVKWHDGEDFSTDDVYFTYHDVIQSEEFTNPVLKANFDGIEINQIDDVTIQFTLDAPNSFFVTNLTTGILPKHILGEVPVGEIIQNSFNQSPVGTGPYVIEDSIKFLSDDRAEVALQVFPEYYGQNPSLKNLRIFSFPNAISLLNEKSALNGIVKVTGDDAVIFSKDERFTLNEYTFPQYTAIFMNMDNEFLKLRGVRLALIKSIDKKNLESLLLSKQLIDTPLLELQQDEWVYQFSKAEAQGALYESDFKYPDGDQTQLRQDSEGNSLSLNLLVREHTAPRQKAETEALIDYLVENWRAVGMEVKVDYAPFDVYLNRLQLRDYDLLLAGQSLGYNFDTYSFWHSTQADGAGLNLSNYKSFAVDALIADIRDSFDKDEKAKKLEKLAGTIRDDFPAFFLYRPIYYYGSDGKVSGINLENLSFTADRFANIEEWVVSE